MCAGEEPCCNKGWVQSKESPFLFFLFYLFGMDVHTTTLAQALLTDTSREPPVLQGQAAFQHQLAQHILLNDTSLGPGPVAVQKCLCVRTGAEL